MHSTKENVLNRSYPVNQFQEATPGAKLQETKQRILLEPSGARRALDMLLPNTGNTREQGMSRITPRRQRCGETTA